MILERLVLRNFGVFAGEQVFNLAPVQRGKRAAPIVLFGGMNGGGKTTILDAIQLVLYGPRARCSKRGAKTYEELLAASIHRGSEPGAVAAIELSFSFTAEGAEHLYEVTRSWCLVRERIQERVEVGRDGAPDGWLSNNWQQVVEELIPLGIAQLCFFDAEQIRFLAEDETTSEALGAAVKSLLGLDLAERLMADASTLQGRLARRQRKSADLIETERLAEQVAAKQSEIDARVLAEAGLANSLSRAQDRARRAEEQFARGGGKLWEQHDAQRHRQGELEFQISACRDQLVDLAAGELPLALVDDLLNSVSVDVAKNETAREAEAVLRLLGERDERVLDLLKAEKVKAATIASVSRQLADDRARRQSAARVERVDTSALTFSQAGRELLDHITVRGLAEKKQAADKLLGELDTARRGLEQVERSLEATPDEESLRDVAAELQAAAGDLAVLKTQSENSARELKTLRGEHQELDKSLKRLRKKVLDEEIRAEEDGRVARLLERTEQTMQKFLRLATERKIDRLAELVTDSFRYLLRKKTLVRQVAIDPQTLGITLVDAAGHGIAKERLSEGEKQIFAISVLWGLSRASARPLPAIIDTPMARLDIEHRNQLVERYFPKASHQVIILSTDTEIERHYFHQLRPAIARAYRLQYDEATRSSVPVEGYFWETTANEVPA
jgi:DNA sulfur modification protein DndD